MISRAAIGIGVLCAVMTSGMVLAQEPKGAGLTPEEFEAKLGYQTGTVQLKGGIATIELPESFRFIGPEGSRKLLVDGWGNPAGAAQGVLGMMIPAEVSPVSEGGWGIVITFDDDGFVNDDDAAKMDFNKLLTEMKEGMDEANAAREKDGREAVDLIGWAEPPHYDAAAHKLYWAKELAFGVNPEHTLNYNIRILGRRGVLVLNAVSGIDQLDDIKAETQNVMSAVTFNEGHRYTDYLPGKDKAAAYGVAGLIVGATAAKAGFFKVLLVGLLAAKKAVVAAVLGLIALVRKMMGGKSAESTT